MIVGQKTLLDKLNNYTIDTFPKSLMLVGEVGSGKHLISNKISELLNISIENITETISFAYISEIYTRPNPSLYLIELDKISIKEQNEILKLVEEPAATTFILLLANSTANVLETIQNRCIIWYMDKYSSEELSSFVSENTSGEIRNVMLSIFHTPGQLVNASADKVEEMLTLAHTIYTKINVANFSNTLSLVDKLAFKDEKTKYNVYNFSQILLFSIRNIIVEEKEAKYQEAYKLTAKYVSDMLIPHIDQKYLFCNFLVKLRNTMRGEMVYDDI